MWRSVQVPAARPDEQRRALLAEAVGLPVLLVLDRPLDRVGEVERARRSCSARWASCASSKSAMKPRAPELSALMTILRSVGPVISTRRSLEVGRRRRDASSRPRGSGASRSGSRAASPRSSARLRSAALREQLLAAGVELVVQLADERERVVGQDLGEAALERAPGRRRSCRPQSIASRISTGCSTGSLPAQALRVRGDLERAAGVGGGDRVGAGGQQVARLALAELGRRLRVQRGCRCRPSRSRSPTRPARRARRPGSRAAARAAARARPARARGGRRRGRRRAARTRAARRPRLVLGEQLVHVAHLRRRTPRRARPTPGRRAAGGRSPSSPSRSRRR